MSGWLLSYPVFFAQHLKTQNQNQNYADKNPISPGHPQGLHLSDPGLEGNNAEDTITDWFSFTLVPMSLWDENVPGTASREWSPAEYHIQSVGCAGTSEAPWSSFFSRGRMHTQAPGCSGDCDSPCFWPWPPVSQEHWLYTDQPSFWLFPSTLGM